MSFCLSLANVQFRPFPPEPPEQHNRRACDRHCRAERGDNACAEIEKARTKANKHQCRGQHGAQRHDAAVLAEKRTGAPLVRQIHGNGVAQRHEHMVAQGVGKDKKLHNQIPRREQPQYKKSDDKERKAKDRQRDIAERGQRGNHKHADNARQLTRDLQKAALDRVDLKYIFKIVGDDRTAQAAGK